MTFTELQTEFFARGFNYLNDAGAGLVRAKAWINDAYLEVCDEAEWPFLEASTTSTVPHTISDLKTIASVVDATNNNPLKFRDRRDIIENVDADITGTAGTPTYWYLLDTELNVYPVNTTVSVKVRYYKVPDALSAGSDVPVIPTRYQQVIVDGAVRRALVDNNDTAEAQAVEQERQNKLNTMLGSLTSRNAFEPGTMQATQWVEL